jgi:hypothetical protein
LGQAEHVVTDLLATIDRHGWAVRHVGPGARREEVVFSYTIGLTAMGHPEVVVQGLPFDVAHAFLNDVGQDVRMGKSFPAGTVTEDLTSPASPVVFIAVEDTSGLTAVEQVYGHVDAVQLVWPDSRGRLPWAEEYANAPWAQPLLGPAPLV